MAFPSKTDKLGLADTNLILRDCDDGRSASVAEATDENGDVAVAEVFGEIESPTASYAVKGDVAKDIVLGGVTTIGEGASAKHYALTQVTMNTSAGSAPTVSAQGEEVPAATATGTYTIDDGLTVKKSAIAQILQSAFTLSGTGCHLNSCNLTASVSFVDATKDGTRLTWDVTNGRLVVAVGIVQTGSTEPTLAAGTGWEVTAPLTRSSPDSDFPTWSATLTKYLTRDADESSASS
jgi:hypothetical protein